MRELMGPSGNEAMTPGAGVRWCGLAGMAGGLLLLIFYAALAARQAIDWQAGSTLGTPIHRPLMGTISLAMLLLIVAVAGVLASRIDRLGWGAGAGGLLALSGFVLWAYAAAENFVAFAEPPWWHALLFPTLVALGSLVFGLGGVRSRALPWGGGACRRVRPAGNGPA